MGDDVTRSRHHPNCVLPDFGAQRRRQAAAIEAWTALRGGGRVPGVRHLDPRHAAGLLWLASHRGTAVSRKAEHDSDDPCASMWMKIGPALTMAPRALVDAGGPVQFTMEDTIEGVAWRWSGILLFYGDDIGRIVAADAIFATMRLATDDAAALIAGTIEAAPMTPVKAALNPWITNAPALSLPVNRLAAARTWAALARTGQPLRQASLHAALGAAFDIMLADHPASDTTFSHERRRETNATRADEAIRLIFGDPAGEADRAVLIDALAHGCRLGIATGRFGALLDVYPGGAAAMAEAERRVDAGMAGQPEPDTRLILTPLDDMLRALLARRAAHRGGHRALPSRIAA